MWGHDTPFGSHSESPQVSVAALLDNFIRASDSMEMEEQVASTHTYTEGHDCDGHGRERRH